MKFRTAAQRSAVIVVILVASICIGYIVNTVGHRIDIKKHPREYSEFVEKYSAEYGVPEYLVYSVILCESEFMSNKVSDDGEIGLMQISPDMFKKMLSITREDLDTGILYDPETNIRYGTYMLSYYYTEYNRWNTVLAIYNMGEDTVKEWLGNPAITDAKGNLLDIPDKKTAEFVLKIERESKVYQNLYYGKE